MQKRGDIQVSFSMIFSIILIIAFIAVVIYAITIIYGWSKCANTGIFKQDLQGKIDNVWNLDESSSEFKESLPSGIEQVCFINLERESAGSNKDFYDSFKKYGYRGNMFFYPIEKACEDLRAFDIKHINITAITNQDNPKCFKNINGKVSIRIDKGFYDALVKLS